MSISSRVASPRTSMLVSPSTPSPREQPNDSSHSRNRAALLDYYGIQANLDDDNDEGEESLSPKSGGEAKIIQAAPEQDQLDTPGFDAEKYVNEVMQKEGVEGVATIAVGLVKGIGNLDSDRRALVYDNYSKLITATDTIFKMRTSMDPLTPVTSTLAPTLSHIAETASSVASAMKQDIESGAGNSTYISQRDTVRWALETPNRLRTLLSQGKREEAENDWNEIKLLLTSWSGTQGVQELEQQCGEIMEHSQ